MSFLSANYSLEEDIIGTVFKELLVGSGIAQESNGIENHNITEKISISNSSKRLRNKKSRLKIGIGKIDKSSVYCILSIFWAMICLFFSPVIPLSIDDEFDVPGIIPSIVHYIVFVAPLLFVLTSTKQSQTLKSVVGGALVSVVIFAGLFFSFGFFYYDFCPFFSEYDRDMPYVTNFVGKLISNNFIVIFVSMLISSLFGWLAVLLVLFIKGQKFSEIIKLFRQNKRIFLLSLAVFTIFIITVGYFFLKWGIIKRLVLFMGEFVANVWVIIVVFVVFGLLACGK